MKLIKAIDRTDFSINLVEYPNNHYAVTFTHNSETRTTALLVYLNEALEIFDGIYDHLLTGELQ